MNTHPPPNKDTAVRDGVAAVSTPVTGQLVLSPTIAMGKQEASLWVCSWCGALVYITCIVAKSDLGVCPQCWHRCDAASWRRVEMPIGPFRTMRTGEPL